MNIFLIGYMGSGKTTIGRLVAQRLGWEFLDTDQKIEKSFGMNIPQIFEQKGEPFFRSAEDQLLRDLAIRGKIVVATGGGMPCSGKNMELIRASGLPVYLKTETLTLLKRLENESEVRPLLHGKTDIRKFIEKHLEEREPWYAQADLTVCTDGRETREIADEIVEFLRSEDR